MIFFFKFIEQNNDIIFFISSDKAVMEKWFQFVKTSNLYSIFNGKSYNSIFGHEKHEYEGFKILRKLLCDLRLVNYSLTQR
jgi:hypothetical protein